MSQFKPREAYASRKESGNAMEALWRGFLSLRDPAGASHAAGPPEDFPARPPLCLPRPEMRGFPATPFWPRRSLVSSPPLGRGGGGSRGVVILLCWQNRCLSRGFVVSNFAQQSLTAYDSRARKAIKHLDPTPPYPPFLRGGADARPAGVATSVASLAAWGKRRISGRAKYKTPATWRSRSRETSVCFAAVTTNSHEFGYRPISTA